MQWVCSGSVCPGQVCILWVYLGCVCSGCALGGCVCCGVSGVGVSRVGVYTVGISRETVCGRCVRVGVTSLCNMGVIVQCTLCERAVLILLTVGTLTVHV